MPSRTRFGEDGRAKARARAACTLGVAFALLLATLSSRHAAHAIGARTTVELRMLDYEGGNPFPRPNAAQRLSWEVRQRTSVDMQLEPRKVRLGDADLFDAPLILWSGDRAFPLFSGAEVQNLRRFVDFGGTVVIDDASPDDPGFDASVRRELTRAFGTSSLVRLPNSHVIFRSFYLVPHPVGRIESQAHVEAVERSGRAAVIYTRHDLTGAYERDNLGNYTYPVVPGGSEQRELAFRFGVNIVLYALCLDYKDDQVHAPFIMRRWTARP
ncbi:MAG TPA: DUF4159 domain-containing protein [Polyangiales bacterium]|nr:DUF4159 domain-containing protein [Polyangiales bacterium]